MITFLLVAITSSGVVAGENEEVYDSTGEPVQADRCSVSSRNTQSATDQSIDYPLRKKET